MKEKYLKCLIVIVVIIIGGLFIYQNVNKENKPLPEVKLKEIVNKNKSFAIMIQEKSETDKYQEYSSNTWPGDDYKFKEAKCIDNNGNEIKEAVTYENDKIILTTNKTVYCTVYFDKSIIGKLREDEELANKDNLSKNLQGGMYRYQGTDDVHNWICFGTSDLSECTNETDSDGDSIPDGIDKYMYRIIGVTKDGQLYLLKETFLKEDTNIGFSWNDKDRIGGVSPNICENMICPEWNESLLFKRLNGKSDGTISGTGNCDYTSCDGANTDIFVDSEYYDYLRSGDESGNNNLVSSKWYILINAHEWMYGDTNKGHVDSNTYNGDYMYAIETGKAETPHQVQKPAGSNTIVTETYKWPETNKVLGKINLMYMHDVAYAYYDGSQDKTRGNPGSATNVAKSWIHFRKDGYNTLLDCEWLSTRHEIESNDNVVRAKRVGSDGLLGAYYMANTLGVRPTLYLSSKAKIFDGDGTKADPYLINYEEI